MEAIEEYRKDMSKDEEAAGGRFLSIAEKNIDGLDEENVGVALYFMERCYLNKGDYSKAREVVLKILSEQYDSVTDIFGDKENIRPLSVSLFCEYAARSGNVSDIKEVEKIIEKDSFADRLYIRDKNEKIVSRVKLDSVVKLREAQSCKNSGDTERAIVLLKELTFASGKLDVDGELKPIRDVAQKLLNELESSSL